MKEPLTHNVAHLAGGAAIGAICTGLGLLGSYPVIGAILGAAAASGYGYWREHHHDKNFSKRDFAEWIVGGVIGVAAVLVWT